MAAKNEESKNKQKLNKFSDEVSRFIISNGLEDLSESLIIEFLECMSVNGTDMEKLDVESVVYYFYGEYNKQGKLIDMRGENAFIKVITSNYIAKLIAEEEAKKKKKE